MASARPPPAAITLGSLVAALDKPLVELRGAPQGMDIPLRSHALAEADDRDLALSTQEQAADLILLVGARGAAAIEQLPRFGPGRLKALFVKMESDVPELVRACLTREIALVAVHPQARWEHVHGVVGQLLRDGADRSQRQVGGDGTFGTQNDLFGLASSIAALTGGMVTIDDTQSRVLAFSPLDDSADEIRRMSILGRGAPPGHVEAMAREGLFERLRRGELLDVVPTGASRRRLGVGIHADRLGAGEYLGTVWVQEGARPFTQDAKQILLASRRFVARLIGQTRRIPSADEASLQSLLKGVDRTSETTFALCAELGLDPVTETVVVAFDIAEGSDDGWKRASEAAGLLALHATVLKDTARVTSLGKRLYVIFVGTRSQDEIVRWARRAVAALSHRLSLPVRAAVAAPVPQLGTAYAARDEVDKVLDASPGRSGEVVTLKQAITQVLLRDILALLRNQELRDPRLQLLLDYDSERNTDLVLSLAAYLNSFGDVRTSAEHLHIHRNTLRYRLQRVREVSGLDLDDPDTRLTLQLQLRLFSVPT